MNNHAEDAAVRNNADLIGRHAYNASIRACPIYQDGTPRPTWDQLDAVAQWSWLRPIQRP
ncbi:hypothetical protein [Brucella intermedia]|uniref:hypothetical protein n=1 Tax=Brucella intermedia TaxID=94625 RepID=UPI00124E2D20|nr:hypothetical protein [Brucella intermedia]KAB2730708.1 hypothetical protein F9L02_11690 [Brucella intermedia]